MKLRLERIERHPGYTMGKLYVDDVFECWVLEDPVREGPKVFGETAIPKGTYLVLLTHSPKYSRIMPQLMDVPGFEGIRIHSGNKTTDTEGCLIVGSNRVGGQVVQSRPAYARLFVKLEAAAARQERIEIEIIHPEAEAAA